MTPGSILHPENIPAQTGDTVRYSHVLQASAAAEGHVADFGHAVGDGYALQRRAAVKSIFPDACDTVWDFYMGQAQALAEGSAADMYNAVRNCDFRQAGTGFEGMVSDDAD